MSNSGVSFCRGWGNARHCCVYIFIANLFNWRIIKTSKKEKQPMTVILSKSKRMVFLSNLF